MLVWLAQNQSISGEIYLENSHKIGRFLPIAFWWSLTRKLQRNSREMGRFFREFVPKNHAKFDFFFHDLSEALIKREILTSLEVLYTKSYSRNQFLFCKKDAKLVECSLNFPGAS